MRSSRTRRRIGIAVGLGLLASAAVLSSAASLNLSGSLGSGTAVIASCDVDGVTPSFVNDFDQSLGIYVTTTLKLANIDVACGGKEVYVTVTNANGAPLGTSTQLLDLPDASTMVSLPIGRVPAAEVAAVAIVISG